MRAEQNAFFEAMNTLIRNQINKLKFNYYIDGVIQSVNSDKTYNVSVSNSIYNNIPAKHNYIYKVGDVVQILVKNGNLGKKYIDGLTLPNTNATSPILNKVLDIIYPIGSVYTNTYNVSPSELIGGTWEKIGSNYIDNMDSQYSIIYMWKRTS